MEQKNELVFLSTQERDELTKKHYFSCRDFLTRYMLLLIRNAGIMTIQHDDCLDLYNECFAAALKGYDP